MIRQRIAYAIKVPTREALGIAPKTLPHTIRSLQLFFRQQKRRL